MSPSEIVWNIVDLDWILPLTFLAKFSSLTSNETTSFMSGLVSVFGRKMLCDLRNIDAKFQCFYLVEKSFYLIFKIQKYDTV